jgi:hypothetical protein
VKPDRGDGTTQNSDTALYQAGRCNSILASLFHRPRLFDAQAGKAVV